MKSNPFQLTFDNHVAVTARPFLKWAGGKSQLLKQMVPLFPDALERGDVRRYVEPFLGGGAVFFYIAQNYSVENYVLCDVNAELVLLYLTVQSFVNDLIDELHKFQTHFDELEIDDRKHYYYSIRELYNRQRCDIDFTKPSKVWIHRAAQMIFLNKTCFNGLYRVNSRGLFNVPFGDYKNPKILDVGNLQACSVLLQRAEIYHQDFGKVCHLAAPNTFIYFDPPYRPLSATSNFTSYSQFDFSDSEQERLAATYTECHMQGALLMLSNSDPTTVNSDDRFFDDLYQAFSIHRVNAARMINAVASKRGGISELVITNYHA